MTGPTVPPGRSAVGKLGVVVLLAFFSTLAILDVAALVWLWPQDTTGTGTTASSTANPTAGPTAAAPVAKPAAAASSPQPGRPAAGRSSFQWSKEQRLLLIVFLAGMLGGVIHGIRSLGWYIGNRLLVWSWAPWYALLPLLGGLVSEVFYLVIRGGFFTAQPASGDTVNVYGFAAFSGLVGLFTNQALLKLQQTFEALLASREQGKDRVGSLLAVKSSQPDHGPQAGGTRVTISGTGFATALRVRFGTQAAQQVTVNSETEVVAVTPPQAPGAVDVELINPDNQNAVLHQGFTYEA